MKVYSTSGEDYLKAVLVLHKKIQLVRSVDVARYLEVSRPSVSHAVSSLCEQGLLQMDGENYLHLTDKGKTAAETVYEKYCFFADSLIALGVDAQAAKADACRLEHAISDSAFIKLKAGWNCVPTDV